MYKKYTSESYRAVEHVRLRVRLALINHDAKYVIVFT